MFENKLLSFEEKLRGKRIIVTGHTGFTGSWASLWLYQIGADILGYSLPPETTPSLFEVFKLREKVRSEFNNINDYSSVKKVFNDFKPQIILHLAAQPLVRRSYKDTLNTFETNVMGTANILEACKSTESVEAVLCITTDKVYENKGWVWPYRENDVLGGRDPYSASKSAAEMVIESYKHSFGIKNAGSKLAIASARGGNIIGGGDWSEDRIIPDFVRSMVNKKELTLRYPNAVRPWQHVLSLVQGYFMLLEGLINEPLKYSRAWNLGPQDTSLYTVKSLVDILSKNWAIPNISYENNPVHEENILMLDSSLARNKLNWQTVWSTEESIVETSKWYREFYTNENNILCFSLEQINKIRSKLIMNNGVCTEVA